MTDSLSCRDIAARYQLRRSGKNWRGDCPACGYTESLVMTEGRTGAPLLWCASCQDYPGVARALGMMPAAARAPDPSDPAAAASRAADREADRRRKREAALRLWGGSAPAPGTLAAIYLAARGIGHLTDCSDIRFRADCGHPAGGRHPAMIALIRDAAGEPLAVHRTYLRNDGTGKADVDPPKATLAPILGGVIRLAPIGPEMAIGEGIETTAAAGLLTGLPAWAAIAAGNMGQALALPPTVRSVVISVDRDPAGERAARAAARRWQAEGRRVRLLLPDRPGTDAADVLRAREVAHA